jgi:hypothetical protein
LAFCAAAIIGLRRAELSVADVVGDGSAEQQRLLQDHADLIAQDCGA